MTKSPKVGDELVLFGRIGPITPAQATRTPLTNHSPCIL